MKKEMKIGIIVVSIVVAIIIVFSGVQYMYGLSQGGAGFLGGEVFQVSGGSSFCGPGCVATSSGSVTGCHLDAVGNAYEEKDRMLREGTFENCDPKCESGCNVVPGRPTHLISCVLVLDSNYDQVECDHDDWDIDTYMHECAIMLIYPLNCESD